MKAAATKRLVTEDDAVLKANSPLAAFVAALKRRFPFRAVPEYDLRIAYVACICPERWPITDDDYFFGVPELVSMADGAKELRV